MFLPPLFVSPLIGMFPDSGDLNREEIFLRQPKFIRLNSTRIITPRMVLIFHFRRPRRPRLVWPLISTNAVLNIGSPPPLSRITFLAISTIRLFTRLKNFEGIKRGIQDFLALGVPVPPPLPLPLRFAPLCLQRNRIYFSRFSSNFGSWNVLFSGRFRRRVRSAGAHLLNSIFVFISNLKGRREHRPDDLLRQPRCHGRILYRRPRLLHRGCCGGGGLRVLIPAAQGESVTDAAMHVVDEPQRRITRSIASSQRGQHGRRLWRRRRRRRPSGRQRVVHAAASTPPSVTRPSARQSGVKGKLHSNICCTCTRESRLSPRQSNSARRNGRFLDAHTSFTVAFDFYPSH